MDNRYSISRSNYIFRGFTDHSTGEKENSFSFQKRGGKIDWKKIAAIDVDNFEHEYSINVLQDNIDNFVFCCIESEIDVKTVNPLFIKLFKVGQLIAEYLLHSQDHLITMIEKMQQKSPKPGNELLKEKYEYNAENEHVVDRGKKTSNKDPVTDAVSCTFCYKVFENSKYVMNHIMRRHPEELAAGIKNVADRGIEQKQISDLLAKEMNVLKQTFDKSLEKAKCEIEKTVDSAVSDLKNQGKNMALNEVSIVQLLDRWKAEEEEKHKADLEKIEREFANKLHKLNLKVSDSEHVIQSLETQFLLSIQEVKKELCHSTETATRELLDRYKTGFSEIRYELQTQLAESHEKCLARLDRQDSELRNKISEIHRENSVELEKFKVFLETTLSKLNGIESVHDLQQELKKYLELCYVKSERRAQKKQSKLKSKGQGNHSCPGITQNVISKSSLALQTVGESTSGNISEVKLGSRSVKNKRTFKPGKPLKSFVNTQCVQSCENVNRSSRSLRDQGENKMGVTPIIIRPVVTEEPKLSSEKCLDIREQSEIKIHGGAKITSGNENNTSVKVLDDCKDEVSVISSSKAKSQKLVGSWLQDETENGDAAINESVNVMHPVMKFELQNNKKPGDESDSISVTSDEKVSYHVTKRLNVALQESPDLVDGLRRDLQDAVKDKMKKIGVNDSYITNADFTEKMDLINAEKRLAGNKYPDYYDIRNWYNKYADQVVQGQVREGGNKRKISFANPEVTAERKRSSSEEVEESGSCPDQSNSHLPAFESNGFSQNGDESHNSDEETESSLARTRLCQSLPVGNGSMRKLPPKPESLGPYSCPKFLHSDISSESSVESLGYPFKENLNSPNKKQGKGDELDDDDESTSGKELSSWDGDDLSSH